MKVQTHLIDTKEKFAGFYKELSQQTRVAFDTEGTSLNPWDNEIISMQFAWDWWNGYYVPIKQRALFGDGLEPVWGKYQEFVVKDLLHILESPDIQITYHNAKYDRNVIVAEYEAQPTIDADSMVYAKLYNDLEPVRLEYRHRIFEDIAGYDDELNDLVKSTMKGNIDYSKIPLDIIARYGAIDALATYRLTAYYTNELKKIKG